jgi:hypothetical protein
VINPTKAKILETMAPTPSTLKRRKVLPTRVVKKTKGGTGRRQTPTDSDDEEGPVVSAYKWSTSTTKVKQTKGGPSTISNRAAAVTADTDSAANSSESEDEEGDSVEVVKKVTKNTGGNLTPAALGGQLQINRNDTVSTLQESVAKLHARNQMLARKITKMGGVDKYELMQIRKMVKEDLFKRVKFITTTAMEAKCIKYLSNKLNVPAERQHEWSATYAHCVRDALNNNRNNVSQDLKAEIKGKKWLKDRKDIEQTTLTKIDAYSYTAILGEPETKEIQAKAFIDIREPINLLQQDYFNLFFDRLMPCVAGKKVWTSRDKMACAITDGGKITITDEAFILNCASWITGTNGPRRGQQNGQMRVKGTVVLRGGATMPTKFDSICNRIRAQRETDKSKAMEMGFLDYAIKQYGRGTKRTRSGILEEGPEIFNELAEL